MLLTHCKSIILVLGLLCLPEPVSATYGTQCMHQWLRQILNCEFVLLKLLILSHHTGDAIPQKFLTLIIYIAKESLRV